MHVFIYEYKRINGKNLNLGLIFENSLIKTLKKKKKTLLLHNYQKQRLYYL